MKILFCSPTRLDRTLGAPKVIMELAEGLTNLGCECKLIGPRDITDGLIDGRHDPERYAAALHEYLLKHASEYDVVDYDHEYLPYERSEFPANCLMVARSVLLHYHFEEIKIPVPHTFRSTASRIKRKLLGQNKDQINRQHADKTGKEADLFITLNSQDRDALIRFGYDGSKVVVVGLGLHPERFAALCKACLDVPLKPMIAFVGTFDYRKGCLDIPGIVEGVTRAVPGTRFRLIGTAGLFQTEAQVLAHFPAHLRQCVEVIPHFEPEELPKLLEFCSAGVFPSYIEGFGFGILEMLAAGLPVVAYDAPGPPDILPRNFLTPRGDIAATSKALVDLVSDPVKLKQARIEARERARNFTWSRAARQTFDAFTVALAAKRESLQLKAAQLRSGSEDIHLETGRTNMASESEGIHLLCAADERFSMPLVVTLRSAATSSSLPVRAFVLNTDLPARTRQRIEMACSHGAKTPKIIWVDADRDYLRDFPLGLGHLSQAAYLRLAMGRMLPADIRRVIYLDSDVLVLKDLAKLWQASLDGNVVGAVRDFTTVLAGQTNALGKCLGDTGITATDAMFNSGVLLVDLEKYRELNVENECIAYLERWKTEIKSADQGALNAVLYQKWKRLDFCWNLQMGGLHAFKNHPSLSVQETAALRAVEPAILHFSGACKPWNSGLRSPDCQRYLRHVHETGWYSAAGFQLWKAKRLALCLHIGSINKFDAVLANFKPLATERPA